MTSITSWSPHCSLFFGYLYNGWFCYWCFFLRLASGIDSRSIHSTCLCCVWLLMIELQHHRHGSTYKSLFDSSSVIIYNLIIFFSRVEILQVLSSAALEYSSCMCALSLLYFKAEPPFYICVWMLLTNNTEVFCKPNHLRSIAIITVSITNDISCSKHTSWMFTSNVTSFGKKKNWKSSHCCLMMAPITCTKPCQGCVVSYISAPKLFQ